MPPHCLLRLSPSFLGLSVSAAAIADISRAHRDKTSSGELLFQCRSARTSSTSEGGFALAVSASISRARSSGKKQSRRWCLAHTEEFEKSDFATAQGGREFEADESLLWKVVLRLNFLHPLLDPDDNVAFQEVCREFNAPKAGSRMDPVGVVILVLAHALKWPPVVRHFQAYLRNLITPRLPIQATPSILADALYDAVRWADGKPLKAMHAILSVAKRSHALSGVAIAASQLGIVLNEKPEGDEHTLIQLGSVGKEYYLKPRSDLADCENVLKKYIEYSRLAKLHWFDRSTSFDSFAQQLSLLMIACHSEFLGVVGLRGGRAAEDDARSRTVTPRTGCQPRTRIVEKKAPPYVAPHIVRHFMLAADRLNVFDYETLRYRDIEEYVPDVTNQATKVANLTLARIKDDLGLDPWYISCHFCFAKQVAEPDLEAVLKPPYVNLYEPIGKWIISLSTTPREDDSHPPNVASLIKALASRTVADAVAPPAKKAARNAAKPK